LKNKNFKFKMIEFCMRYAILLLIMVLAMTRAENDVEMAVGRFLVDKLTHKQLKIAKNDQLEDNFSIIDGKNELLE
jgi:hypothetical protein